MEECVRFYEIWNLGNKNSYAETEPMDGFVWTKLKKMSTLPQRLVGTINSIGFLLWDLKFIKPDLKKTGCDFSRHEFLFLNSKIHRKGPPASRRRFAQRANAGRTHGWVCPALWNIELENRNLYTGKDLLEAGCPHLDKVLFRVQWSPWGNLKKTGCDFSK